MNDILNVITSRRSIKSYKSDPVSKDLIEKIVTAGSFAPSGKNSQSSIILAVSNKEVRDKLSSLVAKARGQSGFDPFYGAPVALVVLADSNVFTHVYDGSVVMENMLLEAHSLGLGACWIHFAKEVFETTEGKELLSSLGIEGNYEGIGTCVVGYPKALPQNVIIRKDNYIYFID